MVTVCYVCCCTVLNMKLHNTIFVLMGGHLPYSVDKFSIQGVYDYDIYISVLSLGYLGKKPFHGQNWHIRFFGLIL